MAGDGQGKQAVLCKLCILFYEADDVIGKKWALLSLLRYVNVPLNRFINAKYVFSSDADSYEDGDGQSF